MAVLCHVAACHSTHATPYPQPAMPNTPAGHTLPLEVPLVDGAPAGCTPLGGAARASSVDQQPAAAPAPAPPAESTRHPLPAAGWPLVQAAAGTEWPAQAAPLPERSASSASLDPASSAAGSSSWALAASEAPCSAQPDPVHGGLCSGAFLASRRRSSGRAAHRASRGCVRGRAVAVGGGSSDAASSSTSCGSNTNSSSNTSSSGGNSSDDEGTSSRDTPPRSAARPQGARWRPPARAAVAGGAAAAAALRRRGNAAFRQRLEELEAGLQGGSCAGACELACQGQAGSSRALDCKLGERALHSAAPPPRPTGGGGSVLACTDSVFAAPSPPVPSSALLTPPRAPGGGCCCAPPAALRSVSPPSPLRHLPPAARDCGTREACNAGGTLAGAAPCVGGGRPWSASSAGSMQRGGVPAASVLSDWLARGDAFGLAAGWLHAGAQQPRQPALVEAAPLLPLNAGAPAPAAAVSPFCRATAAAMSPAPPPECAHARHLAAWQLAAVLAERAQLLLEAQGMHERARGAAIESALAARVRHALGLPPWC